MSLPNKLLRVAMSAAHHLMKAGWFVRRPRTYGAHAVALTPGGKLVLVKLRYAPGWRLPGGGRKPGEDPEQAVLRELREEIGLVTHGRVRLACELDEVADHKRDLASLLVVEEVVYQPRRWSWEIERVIEVPFDRLPADLSPRAAHWIDAVQSRL